MHRRGTRPKQGYTGTRQYNMLQYHSSTYRGSAERNRKVSGIEGRLTTERVTVTPGEEAYFFFCL